MSKLDCVLFEVAPLHYMTSVCFVMRLILVKLSDVTITTASYHVTIIENFYDGNVS